MKTSLLAFAILATTTLFNKVNAQCTVNTPTVSNISSSDCSATFDLTFNLKGNGGNKVTAVYIFDNSVYSNLSTKFYGTNDNNVPTASDLNSANALGVIKINLDSSKTVYLYQKNTRPAAMKSGLDYTVSASGDITIKSISLDLLNCNSFNSLKADVISSQSPDLSSVGCLARGLSFSPNEPVLATTFKGCGSTSSILASFTTTQARTIFFRIYKDIATPGQLSAEDTTAANAVSGWYSVTTSMVNSYTYRSAGTYTYQVQNGEKFNVWVVAYADGVPNSSSSIVTNSCAPLPVSFRSFTAQRNERSVLVKWETVTEQQNRGFNIQRLVGTGAWQNIGFVATQAANGNSSALLSYSFTDANPSSSVSQYRIQQIDIDGKTSYSEIRSVRGEEMSGNMVVYPNPSADGKITLSFDAVTAKDVTVSDMTGRVVKQFRNIRSNHLSIDNLTAGFYTVQVIDQSSAKTMVEKVVIKNH